MYEKSRKKRRLVAAAGAFAATAMVAACAGGGDGGSGEQTIEFSLTGGTVPSQVQVIEDAIATFEEANEGVTVELTEVGWNNAYGQYQTRLTGGTPPDIALLAPAWISSFTAEGAFASADEYVDADILDNAYESGYQGMVGEDGARYGVQWDASVWGMFYRKDLFEQAGLDPESPPTTWDELREVSAALSDADIQPLAIPFAGTDPDSYFLPMLWQAGGEVVNDSGEVTVDTSETLEAATYLHGLVEDGYLPSDIAGDDWEATMNRFIAGDAAIMFNGPWAVGAVQDNAPDLDGEWATAQYPEGPAGPATLGYPNGLVISDLSENKELAGEFINFLFQEGEPSYYFEFMKVTGVFGFTEDFAETDDPFVQDPLNVPFIESATFARNRPVVPWYEEFRQRTFDPALQELVLGTLTPEEFVQTAAQGANDLAG